MYKKSLDICEMNLDPNDFSQLQERFQELAKKASSQTNLVPDGVYETFVETVQNSTTAKGYRYLRWKLKIAAGPYTGHTLEHRNYLKDSEATLKQLEKDCRRVGNPLNELSDLQNPDYTEAFAGLPVRVQVVNEGDFTKTYFKALK